VSERDALTVRYVGDGVVSIPGVGVFQNGTAARISKKRALELLADDAFVVEAEGPPAVQVVLRIGSWNGATEGAEGACETALRLDEPARADLGDLWADEVEDEPAAVPDAVPSDECLQAGNGGRTAPSAGASGT
jgi:hypothetical protein